MAQQGLSPLIWTMRRRFSVRGVDKCLIWWVWMNDLEKKSAVARRRWRWRWWEGEDQRRETSNCRHSKVLCVELSVSFLFLPLTCPRCVCHAAFTRLQQTSDLDGQIPSSGGFLTSQPFHQTHPTLPSATHAGRNLFPLVNSGKHSCSSPTMNTRWLLKCHVAVFLRLPHRNLLQLLLTESNSCFCGDQSH